MRAINGPNWRSLAGAPNWEATQDAHTMRALCGRSHSAGQTQLHGADCWPATSDLQRILLTVILIIFCLLFSFFFFSSCFFAFSH